MFRPSLCKELSLTSQDVKNLLKFDAYLPHKLLAAGDVVLRRIALQALAGTLDGEALLVQQAADLADHEHVVALVIAAVARRLTGLSWGNSCSQ